MTVDSSEPKPQNEQEQHKKHRNNKEEKQHVNKTRQTHLNKTLRLPGEDSHPLFATSAAPERLPELCPRALK